MECAAVKEELATLVVMVRNALTAQVLQHSAYWVYLMEQKIVGKMIQAVDPKSNAQVKLAPQDSH